MAIIAQQPRSDAYQQPGILSKMNSTPNYGRYGQPFTGVGGAIPGRAQPSVGPDKAYNASIIQTGEDYDELMDRFRNAAETAPNKYNPLMSKFEELYNNPNRNYDAATINYSRDPNVSAAISNLGELSRTGGYSEEDIANLRSRGISPIRSIYANAQREMTRQRAIQGGYSPNYMASLAKNARGMAGQIAQATQNVNAGIAENVARNRLTASPEYAGAASREAESKRGIDTRNAEMINEARRFGATNRNASLTGMLDLTRLGSEEQQNALRGMLSLYGTTPALANTFGNQALNQAQLAEQSKQANQNVGLNLISQYNRNRPRFGV